MNSLQPALVLARGQGQVLLVPEQMKVLVMVQPRHLVGERLVSNRQQQIRALQTHHRDHGPARRMRPGTPGFQRCASPCQSPA